ncbi:hypothetical protein EXS74_00635 [Candidatus Woesearchaeota archaeon]|nr:hypothetical protein [Candidatus Woesearchaeota archaeon]
MMNYFWGLGFGWMLVILLFFLAVFIFWLWMFIEALKKRDTLWIVLLLIGLCTMFAWFFALLYYLLEYTKKEKQKVRRK